MIFFRKPEVHFRDHARRQPAISIGLRQMASQGPLRFSVLWAKLGCKKMHRENERPHPEELGALAPSQPSRLLPTWPQEIEIGTTSDFVGMTTQAAGPASFEAPPHQVGGRAS
jgi:hypothetical protein